MLKRKNVYIITFLPFPFLIDENNGRNNFYIIAMAMLAKNKGIILVLASRISGRQRTQTGNSFFSRSISRKEVSFFASCNSK